MTHNEGGAEVIKADQDCEKNKESIYTYRDGGSSRTNLRGACGADERLLYLLLSTRHPTSDPPSRKHVQSFKKR